MNIVIPMAGAGQRFVNEGYKVHKPAILTIDRRTGIEFPMVVCATKDLPGVLEEGKNVIYIDREFHKVDGVEHEILKHYPKAKFITTKDLTDGQASTCMLAKDFINNDEELLIAGCDNGMVIDEVKFNELREVCDMIVFTYKNNDSVLANPDAHGWVAVDDDDNNNITGVSVKKALSDTPLKDNAIVATFWFKKGSTFVKATEKMIAENDRVNNEFYVDEVIKHALDLDFKGKVFEIDRYIGWGTPRDFEIYTNTINYWKKFVNGSGFLGN